jgi:hypothetical protein
VTLQDLGSIGEFVAAIATLATLVYLALQIRQNTQAVRSDTHQAWVSNMAEVNLLLPRSREFARVVLAGSEDLDKLDPEELLQFNTYMIQLFNGFEAIYFQHLNGAVDAIYWNTKLQALRALMSNPGVRSSWEQGGEAVLDPRFREAVQRAVLSESSGQEAATADAAGRLPV